tara:strand:- start:410 stop:1303 length:894 start_codon:yes stop_codon:yes gene_type:complete
MRIGVDLGGTKIEVLALDNSGDTLLRRRVSTPQDNYQATLACIQEIISSTEAELSCQASIGICTPGSISPATGVLRNSNSTCLNNQPLKQDLEQILNREIHIANDANCFTLSEATDGAAKDAEVVFGVIIGTGCGAGIVINKKIVDGSNAIAGEWGHNPLPYTTDNELATKHCWCGKYGCIETFLSGTGFAKTYHSLTNINKTSEQIIADVCAGDTIATELLSNYQLNMAKSLSYIINILDPHVIVLGGGMSNIDSLYSTVPNLWQQYVFSDTVNTRLVAPSHGDSSGVRGAAWLWD